MRARLVLIPQQSNIPVPGRARSRSTETRRSCIDNGVDGPPPTTQAFAETAELRSRTQGRRYLELDGLRGIAALTVVFHHFRMAFDLLTPKVLLPFVVGQQSVLLFFLMSGFVLSLPFWNRGGNTSYRDYLVRRIFRIYVPFVAAVFLSALACERWGHAQLPLGVWFHLTWQAKITWHLLWSQLMMSTTPELNTAFWSLRYEMQMSIAFPLVLLGVRFLRPAASVALFAVVFLLAQRMIFFQRPDPHAYLETLQYGSIFVLGAVLAQCRGRIREVWMETPRVLRALFLLLCGYVFVGYPKHLLARLGAEPAELFLTVLAAAGILTASMNLRVLRKALEHRLPEYFGRVSYSLYLSHGVVLFTMLGLLYGKVSTVGFCVIYVAVALGVAHVFCIAVEEPSLRLGKMLIGTFPGAPRRRIEALDVDGARLEVEEA